MTTVVAGKNSTPKVLHNEVIRPSDLVKEVLKFTMVNW